MNDNSACAKDSPSLISLRLRPGTPLNFCSATKDFTETKFQLPGIIEGKAIMVTPHIDLHEIPVMKTGGSYIISGFSGQHAFSFSARVIQTFVAPMAYSLLSYPDEIDVKPNRNHFRTSIRIANMQPQLRRFIQ